MTTRTGGALGVARRYGRRSLDVAVDDEGVVRRVGASGVEPAAGGRDAVP
jgi:hypothetical protein